MSPQSFLLQAGVSCADLFYNQKLADASTCRALCSATPTCLHYTTFSNGWCLLHPSCSITIPKDTTAVTYSKIPEDESCPNGSSAEASTGCRLVNVSYDKGTVTAPSPHHHRTITAPSLHHHRTITAPSLHHHCTITAPKLIWVVHRNAPVGMQRC